MRAMAQCSEEALLARFLRDGRKIGTIPDLTLVGRFVTGIFQPILQDPRICAQARVRMRSAHHLQHTLYFRASLRWAMSTRKRIEEISPFRGFLDQSP
jgi:hypothetical protein